MAILFINMNVIVLPKSPSLQVKEIVDTENALQQLYHRVGKLELSKSWVLYTLMSM